MRGSAKKRANWGCTYVRCQTMTVSHFSQSSIAFNASLLSYVRLIKGRENVGCHLTLFCPPKLSSDNDRACGMGADTRPILSADIVVTTLSTDIATAFFCWCRRMSVVLVVGRQLSAASRLSWSRHSAYQILRIRYMYLSVQIRVTIRVWEILCESAIFIR